MTSGNNRIRQLYEQARELPVRDRVALVQLLFGTLRLDLQAEATASSSESAGPHEGNGRSDVEDHVPRGVPVDRILARPVPTFIDDEGIEDLRWQYLSEKYLK